MKLYILSFLFVLFNTNLFSQNILLPLSKDIPESIEFRVKVAKSSLEMIKQHMNTIQLNPNNQELIQDLVCEMSKYIWNIEFCLGETEPIKDPLNTYP